MIPLGDTSGRSFWEQPYFYSGDDEGEMQTDADQMLDDMA